MSAKENLELVHRMYEALNAQDLEAHDRYWTKDMIWHGPPGWGDFHGIEAFKYQLMKPFYEAFPDYYAKNDIEVADDNMVSAAGFLTCTHRGEWLGVPATGRLVRMRFSDFWRVRDGRLAENWVMVDGIDVLRQLGVDVLKMVASRERAAQI
jgi:steroid delta-isomerase-like uncharacterized protein